MNNIVLLLDTKPLSNVLVRLITNAVPNESVEVLSSLHHLGTKLKSCHVSYALTDYTWLSADPDFAEIESVIKQHSECIFTLLINEYHEDTIYWAVALGFRSVILKASTPNAIAEAVALSLTGDPVFPTPPNADSSIREFSASHIEGLDDIERDILRRVMLGQSPDKISLELDFPSSEVKRIVLRVIGHIRGKRF